jgi:hypothetical protein
MSIAGLHACGFLSTLAVLWSFAVAVPTFGLVATALKRRGYHPATFVVERVAYRPGYDPLGGIDSDRFWAEGKVDGRQEKLSLQDFVSTAPTSQEQLEALVKPGEAFAVLYNPDASDVMVQDRYLRVLKYDPDFERSSFRRVALLAALGYGPLLMWLALAVPFWWKADGRHRRLALVWLAFDAAGLAVQGFGVILFLMMPMLERHMGR